jgi:hypothetical protein
MSVAGASSASAASALPSSTVFFAATCTAPPPVNSERLAGAAEAVGAVGVALQHADAVDRHAEHVDRQLRIAGGDALAHRHRRRGELDEAVGRHAHRGLSPAAHCRRSIPGRWRCRAHAAGRAPSIRARASKPAQSARARPWSMIFSNAPTS